MRLYGGLLDETNVRPYVRPSTSAVDHKAQDWLEMAQRSDTVILTRGLVPAPYMFSFNNSKIPRF